MENRPFSWALAHADPLPPGSSQPPQEGEDRLGVATDKSVGLER